MAYPSTSIALIGYLSTNQLIKLTSNRRETLAKRTTDDTNLNLASSVTTPIAPRISSVMHSYHLVDLKQEDLETGGSSNGSTEFLCTLVRYGTNLIRVQKKHQVFLLSCIINSQKSIWIKMRWGLLGYLPFFIRIPLPFRICIWGDVSMRAWSQSLLLHVFPWKRIYRLLKTISAVSMGKRCNR